MDDPNKRVNILKIMYVDNSVPQEKLRTKEWLLKMNEIIDFKAFPGGANVDKSPDNKENSDEEEKKE